jgi:hypothetical protein
MQVESQQGPGPTLAGQWEPFDETGPYGAKGSSVYPLPKKYASVDEDGFPTPVHWPPFINGVRVTSPVQLSIPWDGRSPVQRWPTDAENAALAAALAEWQAAGNE